MTRSAMLNWHKKRLKILKKHQQELMRKIAKKERMINNIRKEDLRGRPKVYS